MRRLFRVVGGVDLRPDQQAAYQAMVVDIEAKYRATDSARSSLREAMAKQAEAGAIDRGALQSSIDAFQAALAEERASNHAALTRFGAVLTRPQREQALQELSFFAPGADDAVDEGAKGAIRAPRNSLARGLGLDHEQRLQFIAARKELAADASSGKLVGFDATRIGRRLRLLERVLPTLRSDQRTALSQTLRGGAPGLAIQPQRQL